MFDPSPAYLALGQWLCGATGMVSLDLPLSNSER